MPRRKNELKKETRAKRPKKSVKKNVRVVNRSAEDKPREDKINAVNLKFEEPLEVFPNPEEVEKNKRLVMWSGVTFFMLAIIVIWVLNIKNIFQATPETAKSDFNWEEISDNFSRSMEEAKKGIDEVKDIASEENATSTPAVLPSDEAASATPSGDGSSPEAGNAIASSTDESAEKVDLKELRKKIEELERKLQGE
ncbi:MAG: hypothetical protein WC745_01880 [Patescibacteria group bacterium]|jgi:hypothetical protein